MKFAHLLVGLLVGCGTADTSTPASLTRSPGECGPDETHVVGVYEATQDTGDAGPILLRVERPGNHTLVLSAHEATAWKVTATNGAQLTEIYAVGVGKQTVEAPAGVRVVTESEAEGGGSACGYSWPGGGACDTKQLLRLASLRLNKHPTSFHGCYAARSFTIGEDLAVTSDCTGGLERTGDPQDDVITRCNPDVDESNCDDVVLY